VTFKVYVNSTEILYEDETLEYNWSYLDSYTTTSLTATLQLLRDGTYKIECEATDTAGGVSEVTSTIIVVKTECEEGSKVDDSCQAVWFDWE